MWQYDTLLRELEYQKTKIFILVLLLLVTTAWFGLSNLSVSVSLSAKWEQLSYRIAIIGNSTNYILLSLTQCYLYLKNCTFSQWWLVPKCLPNYIINSWFHMKSLSYERVPSNSTDFKGFIHYWPLPSFLWYSYSTVICGKHSLLLFHVSWFSLSN